MVRFSLIVALAAMLFGELALATNEQVIIHKGNKLRCTPVRDNVNIVYPDKRTSIGNEFQIKMTNSQIETIRSVKNGKSFKPIYNITLVNSEKHVQFNQSVLANGVARVGIKKPFPQVDSKETLYLFNVTIKPGRFGQSKLLEEFDKYIKSPQFPNKLIKRDAKLSIEFELIKKNQIRGCIDPKQCIRRNRINEVQKKRVLSIRHPHERISELVKVSLKDNPEEWKKHFRLHVHVDNGIPNMTEREVIKGFIREAVESNFQKNKFMLNKMEVTIALQLKKNPNKKVDSYKEIDGAQVQVIGVKDVYQAYTNAIIELRVRENFRVIRNITTIYSVKAVMMANVTEAPLDKMNNLKPVLEKHFKYLVFEIIYKKTPKNQTEYRIGKSLIKVTNIKYSSSSRILKQRESIDIEYRSNIHFQTVVNQQHTSVDATVDADVFGKSVNKHDGNYILKIDGGVGREITHDENEKLIERFYRDKRLKWENINKVFVYTLNNTKFHLKIARFEPKNDHGPKPYPGSYSSKK